MDQPYSAWADWLSKFHTWPEAIQALWLVAVPVTLLGVTWLVLRALRDILRFSRRERGLLVYGIWQDRHGRWMVYRDGSEPQEIDSKSPLPDAIGRGQVGQSVSGRER